MDKISRDLELEKRIDAYVKGNLDEEQALKLWEKLLERPDYIELLETELGVKSILGKQPPSHKTETSGTGESSFSYSMSKPAKWMAAAAAVIILVIAVNLLRVETNQALKISSLNQINLAQNLASAPVLRTQVDQVGPADSLLNLGFKAAVSGNLQQALQFFDEITVRFENHPTAVRAYLNKGIIQYNTGNFKEAVQSFQQVAGNAANQPVAKEKAYWYLGNAYINQGELARARDAINRAYAMDGLYSEPAFRLLRKLDYKLNNREESTNN